MLLYSAVINIAAMLLPLMDDNHVEVKLKRMEAKAVCVTYYSRLSSKFCFSIHRLVFFLAPVSDLRSPSSERSYS